MVFFRIVLQQCKLYILGLVFISERVLGWFDKILLKRKECMSLLLKIQKKLGNLEFYIWPVNSWTSHHEITACLVTCVAGHWGLFFCSQCSFSEISKVICSGHEFENRLWCESDLRNFELMYHSIFCIKSSLTTRAAVLPSVDPWQKGFEVKQTDILCVLFPFLICNIVHVNM